MKQNLYWPKPAYYETDRGGASSLQTSDNGHYNSVKAYVAPIMRSQQFNPENTGAAMLKLINTENPPLRVLFGDVLPMIKNIYDQKMKTWEPGKTFPYLPPDAFEKRRLNCHWRIGASTCRQLNFSIYTKKMENIIITGSSSGFGLQTVKTLALKGHAVYATMRNIKDSNAAIANELTDWAKANKCSMAAVLRKPSNV